MLVSLKLIALSYCNCVKKFIALNQKFIIVACISTFAGDRTANVLHSSNKQF